MKGLTTILLSAAVLTACARKEAAPQAAAPAARVKQEAAAPPQLSPDQIMSRIKAAGTPGEEHAKLQPLIGKWKTESKFWIDPGKAPEVSRGSARNEWILGKRFLKQDYTGKFIGQNFQGGGVLGFDKTKKEYFSTWVDSMGTGVMISEGKFDSAASKLEMSGKYSCPITGGERASRTVTRIINKNQYVFEMYDFGPDGSEYKSLEITYKRSS